MLFCETLNLTALSGEFCSYGDYLLSGEPNSPSANESSQVWDSSSPSTVTISHIFRDGSSSQMLQVIHAGANIATVQHMKRSGVTDKVPEGPPMSLNHSWSSACGVSAVPKVSVSKTSSGTGPDPAFVIGRSRITVIYFFPESLFDRPALTSATDVEVGHVSQATGSRTGGS